MSSNTEKNTSDGVRDDLELGMETALMTAETRAPMQSAPTDGSSRRRSANSECQAPDDGETVEMVNTRRRHSVSVSAHVRDNVIAVSGEVARLSLGSGKPTLDTGVDTTENSIELSSALDSQSAARNSAESSGEGNSFQLADLIDLHSPPDIMFASTAGDVCAEFKSNDEQRIGGGDNLDVSSNAKPGIITSLGLGGTPRACCDACADKTSKVEVQDECSRVLFTTDTERSEDADKPSGLNTWYAKHRTDGRFMKPMRHMSTLDRKSRPVPLPRSNTFRARGAGDASLLFSNRTSIPVQYETLSSVQSKISQTGSPGDRAESPYLVPVNFSEIYVDHRSVEEWPGQKSGEHAAKIPNYDESEYDVLKEDVWTSPEVLKSCESDYDVVRDDIWEDVSDTYDGLVGCEDDYAEDSVDRRNSHPMDVSVEEIILSAFLLSLHKNW